MLLGLPCALGYNVWSFIQPMGAGSTVLDFEDFLVSNLLLPGGSLVYLLFCVTKWGWGDKYAAECNTGDGPKMPRWVKPYFKYVLPVLIAADFGCKGSSKVIGGSLPKAAFLLAAKESWQRKLPLLRRSGPPRLGRCTPRDPNNSEVRKPRWLRERSITVRA